MEGYTTILIRKKTRDRLARLKRYRRESYDEMLERILSSSSLPGADAIRQSVERHDLLRSTASRTGKQVAKAIKEAEEMMEQEWSRVP